MTELYNGHSRMCGNYPVEGDCFYKTECDVCDCKCHKEKQN